jgi:hypothetical protein
MALNPQDKIEIQNIVRTMIKNNAEDAGESAGNKLDIDNLLNVFNKKMDAIDNLAVEKIGGIGGRAAAQLLRDEMGEIVKEIRIDVQQAKQFMEILHKKTSPISIQQSVDATNSKLVLLDNRLKEMAINFEKHFTSKFIESVSDSEISTLYKQSGLQLKNIMDEFKVELPTAHRYAHGEVKDLMTRHKLKQFFLKNIGESISI